MSPDDDAYLRSWSDELLARANRVRELIGDAHWLSDGHHKEALIREFLCRYLPRTINISTGFVRATGKQQKCSPEIDILIFDPVKHPPYFNEGGLSIVPPSSVIAHYEVKTKFTKQSLKNALSTIVEVQLILSNSDVQSNLNNIWRCICFYECEDSRTSQSIMSTLKETISEIYASKNKEISENGKISFVSLLPTCIAIMGSNVVFLVPGKAKNDYLIKMFDAKQYSFACAIADMFGSVRRVYGGVVVSELDEMIESLNIGKPYIESIES